jgi:hypothetical protein
VIPPGDVEAAVFALWSHVHGALSLLLRGRCVIFPDEALPALVTDSYQWLSRAITAQERPRPTARPGAGRSGLPRCAAQLTARTERWVRRTALRRHVAVRGAHGRRDDRVPVRTASVVAAPPRRRCARAARRRQGRGAARLQDSGVVAEVLVDLGARVEKGQRPRR